METDVETYLVERVIFIGGLCLKHATPGRRGAPDRDVLLPGARIIFVETKTIGGRLEPWQERYHARLRELGFRVEVIWTHEQVDEFIETLSP